MELESIAATKRYLGSFLQKIQAEEELVKLKIHATINNGKEGGLLEYQLMEAVRELYEAESEAGLDFHMLSQLRHEELISALKSRKL